MRSSARSTNSRRRAVSRRQFGAAAGAGAAAWAFTIVPRRVLGGPGYVAPSERINIGCVGVGGQGTEDLQQFLADPSAQVTAVCDVRRSCDYSAFYYGGVKGREPARELVNATYASQAGRGKYDGCAAFVDFRDMLETKLDAVAIATPDHLHAVVAMAAMRKKLHVYCQKPLSFSVDEARTLTQAAQEQGVVTQMGNQGHATDGLKLLVELLTSGAIGQVREIHCWAGATFGGVKRPTDTPPIPDDFDWDRWLGPAPSRPYHPAYAPFEWRSWRDFGTGNLGDMGCHVIDPAVWALGIPDYMTLDATSTPLTEESWAAGNIVRYRFTAPKTGGAVTLTWYDGGLKPTPPHPIAGADALPGTGGIYVGDEGMLVAAHGGGDLQLYRHGQLAKIEAPPPTLPRGETQYQEWVRACRGGAPPLADFAYAGPLTEMVLLGNVAIQTGKTIAWDRRRFEATNLPEANRLLKRTYRDGWSP